MRTIRTSRWSTPIRAVKPATPGGSRAAARGAGVLARASAPAAAVLTYHRIGDRAHEADGLTVPAGEFAAQMRHLRDAGYQVMPLDQMVAAVCRRDAVEAVPSA